MIKSTSKYLWACLYLIAHSTISLAAGTLSGTVVDASDPSSPVFPVDIDLIDPLTGDIVLGFDAGTNADTGFYLIENIPPGQYKIFFNAVDSANNYADELYNDVLCDNGGSDNLTD